jgi:hypothetical protein
MPYEAEEKRITGKDFFQYSKALSVKLYDLKDEKMEETL